MSRDGEREKLVKARIAELDEFATAGRQIDAGAYGGAETLSELLALAAAQARHHDVDEGVFCEVLLRYGGLPDRESLNEAYATMSALGYDEIATVLRRLARSAKPRETWRERMARERRAAGCATATALT